MDINTQTLHSMYAKLASIEARMSAIEAKIGESHDFIQPEAEPKADVVKGEAGKGKAGKAGKGKPKVGYVTIKGHPTRATWTDEMRYASATAYNKAKGTYLQKNRLALLAAQAVA